MSVKTCKRNVARNAIIELWVFCTDSSKRQFKFDYVFGPKDDQGSNSYIMLEVYNKKISDLLADSPDQLSKREYPRGICNHLIKQTSDETQDASGLSQAQVEILTNGQRNIAFELTNANEMSSHSHS
ncbi:hypothetical protein ZIOFF_046767 [Zingiber officinale]|uniref:Kinesin motor domain-containing protein n=1 Tax=Zingiber officinale TaxID=94328 RepID=A0A8J5FQH1_ZINOF|nr:hypothetical protein ZIOFF_046767 [Zingiber officinale]